MIKSHYRDYATDAFRFLAKNGPVAAYKMRLYNDTLRYYQLRESCVETGISAPTEAAVIRAEQAVLDAMAEIADMEAAEFALTAVRNMRGEAAEKAVRAVYMLMPDMERTRGEIEHRVIYASTHLHASRRTVYGWLKLARLVFAEKRGLRTK